jgi:hypothetical protein
MLITLHSLEPPILFKLKVYREPMGNIENIKSWYKSPMVSYKLS